MSADVSVDKSVGLSMSVPVGVSVGVAVGASADVSVGDRGLPWYAVDAAVEIAVGPAAEIAVEIAVGLAVGVAVEIAMASAIGLHSVPLLNAAFRGSTWNIRGSPWKVRGSPWSVRGCPWNAVDMAVECRGGASTLPRCFAKNTIMYIPRKVAWSPPSQLVFGYFVPGIVQ